MRKIIPPQGQLQLNQPIQIKPILHKVFMPAPRPIIHSPQAIIPAPFIHQPIQQAVRINHPQKKSLAPPTPVIQRIGDVPDDNSINKINAVKDRGRGRILVIIGNGPSINEVDLSIIKDYPLIDTMSINCPDSRLWPTTYWAFYDQGLLHKYASLWAEYNGITFNSTAIRPLKQNSMHVQTILGDGWATDLTKGLYIGRSSVYASMQIAQWMNYHATWIFGVDMNPIGLNGKMHFYGGGHDVPVEERIRRFEHEAKHYGHAATLLSEKERNKFKFCSSYNPHKFPDKFVRIDHKVAIDQLINSLESINCPPELD